MPCSHPFVKQLFEKLGAAREIAAEHFQKLQMAHAESSSIIKSHTALITGFRTKPVEFEEQLGQYLKHTDELYGSVQSLEERVVELQGQQCMLDKLEAIIANHCSDARDQRKSTGATSPASAAR